MRLNLLHWSIKKTYLGPTCNDGSVASLTCIFAMLELCDTGLTPFVLAGIVAHPAKYCLFPEELVRYALSQRRGCEERGRVLPRGCQDWAHRRQHRWAGECHWR